MVFYQDRGPHESIPYSASQHTFLPRLFPAQMLYLYRLIVPLTIPPRLFRSYSDLFYMESLHNSRIFLFSAVFFTNFDASDLSAYCLWKFIYIFDDSWILVRSCYLLHVILQFFSKLGRADKSITKYYCSLNSKTSLLIRDTRNRALHYSFMLHKCALNFKWSNS